MTRESKSYVTTISKSDPNYDNKIADIRNQMKVTNNILREDYEWESKWEIARGKTPRSLVQYRVCLRPRKPIKKHKMINIFNGSEHYVGYDWAGNVIGGIENASQVDVYIYRRSGY